jgi:hypothetical protein
MIDREEAIRRGRAVEQFLAEPAVKDAIAALRAEQIKRWLEDDAPGARYTVLALDLLESELRRAVSNAAFELNVDAKADARRPRRRP